MTTGSSPDVHTGTPAGQWQRLREFTRSDRSRPAMLGLAGAVAVTAGGLGAGSTRVHDPLLETLHLSWLRFGHGLVVSSVLLWGGVAVMLAAWLWLGRRMLAGRTDDYTMIATTGFWLAPLLLSVPLFSRDTYSYLAQGALLRDGFDPYAVGPIENDNGLLDDVSPIWMTTTAPYGPAFILVARFVTTIVGDNVVAGAMLLRLGMLPGLVLLIWAARRIARHVGANTTSTLWVCVLNPLVILHLMGGVHNEMLMAGLMAAGIALIFADRAVTGFTLVALATAVKATAGIAAPFLVWVWMRNLARRRGYRSPVAFLVAGASSVLIFVVVFAVSSLAAGVGLGWLTALAGSVKIINWLTIPTAVANLTNAIGGLFMTVNFYAVLEVTRIAGLLIIAAALTVLWWRYRRTDRDVLIGMSLAMVVVVLFVPAALPWYYSWPLAVGAALIASRSAIALVAGFSTWIMVIFKPDGSHGMYSLLHVALATGCAIGAWYYLSRPEQAGDDAAAQQPAAAS